MKNVYIQDILNNFNSESAIELFCWIKEKRKYKNFIIFELTDSTGNIRATAQIGIVPSDSYDIIAKIKPESSVRVEGKIVTSSRGIKEILLSNIDVIGNANIVLNPRPRKEFNIFDDKYIDYTLKNRQLFIRNPKIMSVMKLKNLLITIIREWFNKQNFFEIDTPILTQATLYEDDSTFKVDYFGTPVYLSQCATLYLEAALYAFEKVFTITPAFRAQPSKSRRHNPEFYHVKGQMAFCGIQDMITLIENMISDVCKQFQERGVEHFASLGIEVDFSNIKIPLPRISYCEAISIIKKHGIDFQFGNSFAQKHEALLGSEFTTPFFITGMPERKTIPICN